MENKENRKNEKSLVRRSWDFVKPGVKTIIEVGIVSVLTAVAASEYFVRKNFVEEEQEDRESE